MVPVFSHRNHFFCSNHLLVAANCDLSLLKAIQSRKVEERCLRSINSNLKLSYYEQDSVAFAFHHHSVPLLYRNDLVVF